MVVAAVWPFVVDVAHVLVVVGVGAVVVDAAVDAAVVVVEI